jgi:DNA-binding SARP family transcriptional activator
MHRHQHRQVGRPTRTERPPARVDIELLGGFQVSVDGAATPEHGWRRRSAAALVKVLALAPGQRLHREQVIDLLWPDEPPSDAAPKLHKAAHFARKAAGRHDAVVLRNDVVQLFPTAVLTIDALVFDELSRRALSSRDATVARAAIDQYAGELLPDDRYEEWADERRELLRLRHLNVLRLAGQWLDVSELEPSDEDAHIEVMRDLVANGDPCAALAHFERLERVLDREFGAVPGRAAQALRDDIESATAAQRATLDQLAGFEDCVGLEDLVAELAEVTQRQTRLIRMLTSAAAASPCYAALPG